ncbi:MAG: tripartite tricarboxylate transporter permease [archaeon]|nr:tripartite tricarboxylate transporter permease [Nanoarchaeota archaeon]
MILEIVLAMALGVLSGIFTGLIPGIHVNLISVLVISFSTLLLGWFSPLVLSIYILSLAITHSFLDSLPSIYLGAPDEAQALSVLPGHKLLQRGEGHNAIVCTVIGSFGALLMGLGLFPVFILGMGIIYPLIKAGIGYILIVVVAILIYRDKGKRLQSLYLFLISGVLGILVFSIPNMNQPLFPMLSGLFGFSIMLVSLVQKAVIPKQDFSIPLKLEAKGALKAVTAASSVGFVAAFLPGFGNSQAAILASSIIKDAKEETFLTLVGGINTANMLISIGTAYALSKSRNGAILAIRQLLDNIDFTNMILFLLIAVIVGGIASVLAVVLSKVFSKFVSKVSYVKIILSIIVFVTVLTFIFDGFIGLIILITATAIGLTASYLGVGKNHLMGSLILPVSLYFIL